MTARLVPAYDRCVSGNGTHGAPLAAASCDPPVPSSRFLTVGTTDANGQASNFAGSATLKTVGESPIDPANGDQADVDITAALTDVRQTDLSDYTGELQGVLGLRITDRESGPAEDAPATVTDTSLPFTITCVSTVSDTTGGACNVATTADTITPGLVLEGRRSIWELSNIEIFDGGADGDVDTADNTLFVVQGLFAP
jgi:hypothetical protein